MAVSGGYAFIRQPLLRASVHTHTTEDGISQEVLDGLNAIQRTPWVINTFTHDVMMEAHARDLRLPAIPDFNDTPLGPRVPDHEWEAMDLETRKAHRQARMNAHTHNAHLVGKREAFLRTLVAANTMRDKAAFWFPHSIDFRTRCYPIPGVLHPQADDCAKSLLMFANGHELGASGVYWLACRVASTFGHDKLPWDDRLAWTITNEELVIDSAINPLDGERFWLSADDPWAALAACHEWWLALSSGNPETFISHLPLPRDGSCNGIQHLSLLARDPVGAKATNCSADEARHDVYQPVADAVIAEIAKDAAEGVPEALAWTGKVSRSTVKRAVMTTPYGVTNRGITMQLVNDGHTRGVMSSELFAATYLQGKIALGLNEVIARAREVMGYFQDTASVIAQAGRELTWVTPTGSLCRQRYATYESKKTMTVLGWISLASPSPGAAINARKQALASAPNIVHSFDASMLYRTVLHARDQYGITDFAGIHDSYATHAGRTTDLDAALREAAHSIYKDDWLGRLDEHWRDTNLDLDLPKRPTLGTFDPAEVLKAPYLFS